MSELNGAGDVVELLPTLWLMGLLLKEYPRRYFILRG